MTVREKWKAEHRILRISRNSLEDLIQAIESKGFNYTIKLGN